MDKSALIRNLRSLHLNPSLESSLIGYVEKHELNQTTMNKIAGFLETLAKEQDIEAEIWTQTKNALLKYQSSLIAIDTKNQQQTNQILDEVIAKIQLLPQPD
jgi:hypothetical protein